MPLPADWNYSSRDRLVPVHAQFFDGETLFDRIGKALCDAASLPRKEFHESWEVARRVHRRLKGRRPVDLCAGHGLTGLLVSIMDKDAPAPVLCDRSKPDSHAEMFEALSTRWPKLKDTTYVVGDIRELPVNSSDLVVSVHACGPLTDKVLDKAVSARAPVAVLPCCHSERLNDDRQLAAWMPVDVAIDAARAMRLQDAGYDTHLATIPERITPKNRLILGWPKS